MKVDVIGVTSNNLAGWGVSWSGTSGEHEDQLAPDKKGGKIRSNGRAIRMGCLTNH
jgi:hypothetical protein